VHEKIASLPCVWAEAALSASVAAPLGEKQLHGRGSLGMMRCRIEFSDNFSGTQP
jgi:hypothetical protein